MLKKLILLILLLLLVACGGQVRIKKEIQEVHVPLLYCPAPPEVIRPTLPIHNMSEDVLNQPGKVAQHYKATVKILQGYALELETILREYDKADEAYEELRKRFKENWDTEVNKGFNIPKE